MHSASLLNDLHNGFVRSLLSVNNTVVAMKNKTPQGTFKMTFMSPVGLIITYFIISFIHTAICWY